MTRGYFTSPSIVTIRELFSRANQTPTTTLWEVARGKGSTLIFRGVVREWEIRCDLRLFCLHIQCLTVLVIVTFQYDPELVLVSAGFDAAWGDPLGKCKVSPEMYGHMTHHLQSLANGKVR